jgi:hypothetical protein
VILCALRLDAMLEIPKFKWDSIMWFVLIFLLCIFKRELTSTFQAICASLEPFIEMHVF